MFLKEKCALLSSLILLQFSVSMGAINESQCGSNPCGSYSLKQTIVEFWKLAKNTSPLVDEYRQIILDQLPTVSGIQLIGYLSLSFWAANFHTEYTPGISPSCAMLQLAKASIGDPPRQEYIDAVNNYSELFRTAIQFAYVNGLSAANCSYVYNKANPVPPKCEIDFPFETLLASRGYPADLQNVVSRLIASSNEVDRLTGYSALASMTDTNISFFISLTEWQEFMTLFTLEACFFNIPKTCCCARQQEIINAGAALGPIAAEIFSELTLYV